jgi:hypothetical protein
LRKRGEYSRASCSPQRADSESGGHGGKGNAGEAVGTSTDGPISSDCQPLLAALRRNFWYEWHLYQHFIVFANNISSRSGV